MINIAKDVLNPNNLSKEHEKITNNVLEGKYKTSIIDKIITIFQNLKLSFAVYTITALLSVRWTYLDMILSGLGNMVYLDMFCTFYCAWRAMSIYFDFRKVVE